VMRFFWQLLLSTSCTKLINRCTVHNFWFLNISWRRKQICHSCSQPIRHLRSSSIVVFKVFVEYNCGELGTPLSNNLVFYGFQETSSYVFSTKMDWFP
jgi:hypothetical protein